ncbi:hypothetical protein BGW36DRAFT_384622 [Talaromyces proteolyticus]|uniref:Rhodopsin domain-containing protein n=1 Tax=Talaromyces proteolyticus TaxID=1131652 RepID=A0AAD4PW79_9EURO|nr:uncharacterized protein BGW36DRAFT_384622 [Talaromyces proteolyticus]KAH8694267.1 hypothetical protein BGW36DRAFT_384622 [Talaromyces proteolyticus]
MSSGAALLLVSEHQLLSTAYAMISIATVFTVVRTVLRFTHRKGGIQIEDYFAMFSWASFIVLCVLYIVVTPPLYRVDTAISTGQLYPTMEADAMLMVKIFFANTMIFWIVLWSVKLSLLFLYRRLFEGLPGQMRWWWAVFVFTIMTLIGCIISNFTSCASMHEWFTPGLCSSHRDVIAQVASLYFAFAVDVITDIMIMLLPIKLIWALRLPLGQKFAIGGLFSIGIICVVMAVVRTVQIGSQAKSNSTPSSSWLSFWAMIEAGIAVVIGTLPVFAIFFRRQHASRRGYNDYRYRDGSGFSNINSSKVNSRGIPLSDRSHTSQSYAGTPIKGRAGGINITSTLEVTRSSNDLYPLRNSYPESTYSR